MLINAALKIPEIISSKTTPNGVFKSLSILPIIQGFTMSKNLNKAKLKTICRAIIFEFEK
jgi:hypothetical protein